jgi:hypothetical protein
MEKASHMSRWLNLAFMMSNAIGACVYVIRAKPSWVNPLEHGEIPITGEPFVWAAGIFPVVAVFVIVNLIWGSLIIRHRDWRIGRWWLPAAAIWLIAIGIDFAHH